jgi:hypothetical protein
MEWRKDRILTGAVSLGLEAQRLSWDLRHDRRAKLENRQEMSAEEVTRLAGWIEVLQDYLGEFSGVPGMTLRQKIGDRAAQYPFQLAVGTIDGLRKVTFARRRKVRFEDFARV